ncbi:MAG TPA: hypothetical protein VMT52_11635 [Planctomycetota bacterium]|nr:hypothetical protein [Planctomycetota bacterium]
MRQNLIVALLSICCTLLAVDVVVTLRGSQVPPAYGQATGNATGSFAIATVQGSGSEGWCWIFDYESKRLCSYVTKNQGIELKGARELTYDLKIRELPPAAANTRLTVLKVKELVEKSN